jgi:hypothetical protein
MYEVGILVFGILVYGSEVRNLEHVLKFVEEPKKAR